VTDAFSSSQDKVEGVVREGGVEGFDFGAKCILRFKAWNYFLKSEN